MDKKNTGPRKRNDELLKGAFEDHFKDFLRFMYPEADKMFDFNKAFTFMDKELLSIIPDRERKKGNRVADLLVKVHLLNGSERGILVHTEIEGAPSKDFAERIFQYHYRIFDRYNLPVETIAIFTSDKKLKYPNTFQYKIFNTSLNFTFHSYHIFDHTENELLKMNNIFAYIVLACQNSLLEQVISEEKLAEQRFKIARTLIQTQQYDKDKILGFLHFLKNLIFITDNTLNKKFNTFINQLSGGTLEMGVFEVLKKQERDLGRSEGKAEGRNEGIAEGRNEGIEIGRKEQKESLVKSLIIEFNFSDEYIVKIAKTSLSFVKQQRRKLESSK